MTIHRWGLGSLTLLPATAHDPLTGHVAELTEPATRAPAGDIVIVRASLSAAFIPAHQALHRRIRIPPGAYKEVVLCLNLIGNNPGCNLRIDLYDEAGNEIWSIGPARPACYWRTTSYKEILFSYWRSTSLGLLSEAAFRALAHRPGWSLFYEIPAARIAGGENFCLSLRRLSQSPVFLRYASFSASNSDPGAHVEHDGPLEAYANRSSLMPGEAVELSVHAPEGTFDVEIVRYGSPDQVLFATTGVSGSPQKPVRAAYSRGAQWPVNYRLTFDPSWKPGFYGVRLSDPTGGAVTIPLIVKGARQEARLLVLASTHTWAAYNDWGGASTYRWCSKDDPLGRDRTRIASRLRPNPTADPDRGAAHLARGLLELVRWLEAAGYDYELAIDQEVDDDAFAFGKFRCVALDSHAEYCTSVTRAKLEQFLSQGGRLLYPSGNALWWKIQSTESAIEVVKPGGVFTNGETGGMWADLGAPPSLLTGVGYTLKGVRTYAPYRVLRPDHWVFAGTGIVKGSKIGQTGAFGGASGHETDKIDRHSPKSTILLAAGCNPGRGGANMVYLERPDGGEVFSAGSITFLGCIRHDAVIDRIMRNVLDRFLRGQ